MSPTRPVVARRPWHGRRLDPTAKRGARLVGLLLGLILGLLPGVVHGQQVPTIVGFAAGAVSRASEPPMRLAERLELQPMHLLDGAADGARDQLRALERWNLEGREPVREGFARALPVPLGARDQAQPGSVGFSSQDGAWVFRGEDGRVVWGTSIAVTGAERLRLGLREVRGDGDLRFWVWGESEAPIVFDTSLRDGRGELWTPSVAGPTIYFEASWSGDRAEPAAPFVVERVAQLVALSPDGLALPFGRFADRVVTACLVDAACLTDGNVAGISVWKRAIARLSFMSGGQSYLCTGGLLNSTDFGQVPYLLTSHGCVADASDAASLEAFWDYTAASCQGSAPALSSLPRSNGATLLAASASSDATLLRLTSAPGARAFLGWDAAPDAASPGAFLPRLSHPLGGPMAFSASAAWGPPLACGEWPIATFLYSDPAPELSFGATFAGSGGAPALRQSGQVVGQLAGACGPSATEPCLAGAADSVVDGRFSSSYAAFAPFLAPTGGTAPCVRDAQTACLLAGRFEVRARWSTAADSGAAQVMSFDGARTESEQSAFFYFFDPANFEMGVKMADACQPAFGNRFWVFVSGLTNQGYAVTVRDSHSGRTRVYSNPIGTYPQTIGDTDALPCD